MMKRGVIVIPTFRRPGGLAKALACLDRLATDAHVSVLVAENDPAGGEGREVVIRQASLHRLPIRWLDVAERGVSHVRNALIATALAEQEVEFVACMDDDEWPEPQWLQELIAMQERTGADIVGGTLLPAFASEPPEWARHLELFRQEQPDGYSEMVWGTCNVLITRPILERMKAPWFDPELGLTGGEDMEFFARARNADAKFAWATAAVMHEDVPEGRMRLSWVFRRAFRIGSTNALVQRRWRYRKFARPLILIKSVGRLAAAGFLVLRHPANAGQRMEAFSLAARSLGEMASLLGLRYREYGPVSGSAVRTPKRAPA